MKIIKIVIALALFLIALALGSQNQVVVTFNYLIAQGDFHLSALLGGVFVVGFGLAWVVCCWGGAFGVVVVVYCCGGAFGVVVGVRGCVFYPSSLLYCPSF